MNNFNYSVANAAFKWLLEEKDERSCGDNLKYSSLTMQKYLLNSQLSVQQKKLLFQLRCNTSKVSINNPITKGEVLCPFGCPGEVDCQRHLLVCPQQGGDMEISGAIYEDIFCSNSEKQAKITQLYQDIFDKRDILLKHVGMI